VASLFLGLQQRDAAASCSWRVMLVVLDDAGHLSLDEAPDRFVALMEQVEARAGVLTPRRRLSPRRRCSPSR
jgi:pimeloyl-ACP methyl ester carboxylesterase